METVLEHILTNSYKAEMISYLKSHPTDFEEAVVLALSDKQPYSWSAAWLLWSCMEDNDHRLHRYLNEIIASLSTKNDNQVRDLLIILQRMEISDIYEGELFNICVKIWETIGKKPAVRYNAFKLIVKIAKKYPDLLNEVALLTQIEYMDSFSDTGKKSIYKMIDGLHPKTID